MFWLPFLAAAQEPQPENPATAAAVAAPSSPFFLAINDLRSLREVVDSPRKNQLHTIELEFVVNYYDPTLNILWVEVDRFAALIPLAPKPLDLVAGQRVRVIGKIIPAEGLDASRVKIVVVALNDNVTPLRSPLENLEGRNGRIIMREGLVERQVEADANHLILDLLTEGRRAVCHVWHDGGTPLPDLTGALVRVSGTFVGQFDPSHRLLGIDLWVPALANVVKFSSLASDPRFNQPITPLGDLSKIGLRNVAHVVGVIQSYEPGRRLVVHDHTGKIELATEQIQPVRVGDTVEIIGYTSQDGSAWTLLDPLFRARSTADLPDPPAAQLSDSAVLRRVEDVLSQTPQEAERGHTVKLRGVVTFAHPEWRIFFLNDGSAGLQISLSNNQQLLPQPGSSVSVVGLTAGGVVSPTVVASHLVVDGVQPLPMPRPITTQEAATGSDDAQWIEMRGVLLEVKMLDGWLSLRLSAEGVDFFVSVPTTEIPQIPLGTELRVRGVCTSWISNITHRFGGFFLFTSSLANVQALDDSEVGTLSLADRVRQLRPEDAARGQPVKLSGIVTFSHQDQRTFFLNDGSASVLVKLMDEGHHLPASGTAVIVVGKTAAGIFYPLVEAGSITVHSTRRLPSPRVVTLEQALTGVEDAQWVEIRGNLRRIQMTDGWARLLLTASAGEFVLNLPLAEAPPLALGSFLSVRGVCVNWPAAKNRVGGIFLYATTAEAVQVMEAAPADPFLLPVVAISNLQQYRALPGQEHQRVLIHGAVLHHVPGRYLVVENATGIVRALSRDTPALTPGDLVDVAGLPDREGNQSVLRDALYRRTGPGPKLQPLEPADGFTLDTALNGRLVKFTGTLLDLKTRAENTRLFVQTGSAVHEVVFDGSLPPDAVSTWKPTSFIAVLGLYRVEYNEYAQPVQFSIQLRTPQDIVVLEHPAWWTLRRALLGLGVIGGCLVFGLSWAATLRRRVQQQTEMIRTQLAKEANLEARHREIIENASDFIFTTDLNGKFTSFNPAGERITGYTRHDALQLNIRDLIAPEDAVSGTALLSLAVAPEQSQTARFETRFQTRDGGRVWMETSTRLIHEAGHAVGLLGVARDVSERKQIEDELKRARTTAEATTQAKSAFLANMSHEIRTPMSGVIGMTNLLLDTPLRPDQREFAEAINGSAEALLTILNDILDFSKIEAGKLQFEVIDFDLASAVDDSLSLLAARAVAKNVELAVDFAIDLPRSVCGDPGRLRQVLLNLIGNAVKFTERGEVLVVVSREAETPTDVRVRFEISDTGIGMSPEAQQQLFRPFMQADSSTSRKFGGTGLGLAISKQIVELMHGEIGVRSEPGLGTTFWFTVGLKKQPDFVPINSLPELTALKGIRVLAVDDHATNRKIIDHYLQGWQMRCDLAASGSEALRFAASAVLSGDPYRLVLLDYDMPEMNGLALAQAIRADQAYDGVPVMLLTSLDRRFSKEELTKIGLSRVLNKPIRRDELHEAILHLFSDSAEKGATPSQVTPSTNPEKPAAAPASVRVIVAEDNLVNQRIIQTQLKKLGINADLVTNGGDLLEALEHKSYDLVLMDCQMPGMDGYEATRQLRASLRFPDLRVIAMTANTMQGDREKCLAAGMDDYLSKPTRFADLRDALARWSPRTDTPVSSIQHL